MNNDLIPSISSLIVDDLGKLSLSSIEGITATKKVKLLNVMVKSRPRRWIFFTSKQFLGFDIHISDVLSESSDAFTDLKGEVTNIPNYDSERTIAASINGKASLKILDVLPSLKAGAGVKSDLNVKIISGGLIMKTVDEKKFELAMRGRTLDKNHSFTADFCKEPRCRMCVIKTVVELSKDTVFEFQNKFSGNVNLAAEVGAQGGSVNAEFNKCNTQRITLEAGTVLACQWQPLNVDKKTREVSLCYKLRVEERAKLIVQAVLQKTDEESEPREEGRDSDKGEIEEEDEDEDEDDEDEEDEEETDDDEESRIYRGRIELSEQDYKNLYKMCFARDDDIQKLKTASCAIMKCRTDIEALLDLNDSQNGVELQPFKEKLRNRDAVWSLLELVDYKCENNRIQTTYLGPFAEILQPLLEAMLTFEVEDLELIAKCNAYQKKEILRIIVMIVTAVMSPDRIKIDPLFEPDLQKDPVKHVMALLSFDVDFVKGELSQESKKSCILEPMLYLLSCL